MKEAFIHAKEIFEPEELVKWFTIKADPFYRSGSWKMLLPLYEELLDIEEKSLGPENPETASVLNGIAGIYRYMGNYEESLRLFTRALKIREKLPGAEQPETGDTLSELGTLYYLMDRQEEALSYYKRALEIQEKFLSPKTRAPLEPLTGWHFFIKEWKSQKRRKNSSIWLSNF